MRPASGTGALAIQKAGAGTGTVTSAPAGLTCGATCSQTFAIGTVVTLTAPAASTVDEGTGFVDHSWGTGGPANLTDDFSARFTRTVTLAAGTYRFTVVTDDGSRLWIDDQPTIAAWWDHGPTTHTVDVALSAGEHALRYQS